MYFYSNDKFAFGQDPEYCNEVCHSNGSYICALTSEALSSLENSMRLIVP